MSGQVKILIIEDDAPLAKMLVYLLTRAGCDVMVTHTGIEGMQLAQEIQFSLIALDIDLPDLNGLDICKELKQRHFSRLTPIMFMSGRPLEADIQRGLEAGAVDYITKPFGASEFVSRILSFVQPAPARQRPCPSDFPDEDTDANPQSLCDAPQGNQ